MPKSGTIIFNGESSSDYGIFLTEPPELVRPDRKVSKFPVQGRNGDIIYMEDAWENYDQPFEIGFGSNVEGELNDILYQVFGWLNSTDDYARLETSLEPDVFRLAAVVNGADVVNHMNRVGEATLTFNCRPERFYKFGEEEIDVDVTEWQSGTSWNTVGTFFQNPSRFWAKPLYKLVVSGTVQITVTDGFGGIAELVVKDVPSNTTIYYDSDSQDAVDSNGNSMNSYIAYGWNNTLMPPWMSAGENHVLVTNNGNDYDGTVHEIKVTPRWWTL